MPSSISNSRKLEGNGAIVLLLAALFLFYCGLEVAMRTVVSRVAKAEKRYGEDYRAALGLRPRSMEGSQTILIVGNSLLLAGVERESLRKTMEPSYSVALFPIENTTYLDWYFGLRRFFAEGSRPAVVVLCLSSPQLISRGTNGEAFAHSMMQLSDILAVAEAAKLDTTTASNYFFANLSRWLGGRWYVRNWLLEKWMPNSKALVEYLAPRNQQAPASTRAVVEEAVIRLREIAELSRINGARFLFLVPPSRNSSDPAVAIQSAAAEANIAVLIPYQPGEMPATAYSDGFHLNVHGAGLFTERLRLALVESLSRH